MADADSHELTSGATTPRPDPTVLTDQAISKAVAALRDYIDGQFGIRDERLAGIDEATKLRLNAVAEVSSEVDAKVGRLEDLTNEKFRSVAQQFSERDTRSEREARDNKVAVDAAFAAQKEAAAKQDEGNQKAIDKSEVATAEKINKLAELFQTTTDAIGDKIDDLKERVTEVATTANGSVAQKLGGTENRTATYALIGVVGTVVAILVGVVSFALAHLQ